MIKRYKLIVPDTYILESFLLITIEEYFRTGFEYHNLVQDAKVPPMRLTRIEYFLEHRGEYDSNKTLAKLLEKEVEPYFSLIDYIHYTLRFIRLIHSNGSLIIEFEIL